MSGGDVPPSEAGRFWNFDTEFTQFSDNFYAKFIPLEMFKYLWNIMFINVSYKSAMFFNLGIQHFLSFLFPLFLPPFPLSSLLFSFPFLFLFFIPFSFSLSFSLSLSSSFPFLFSLPFPLFSFLSPFFPFPIFALLPDFWCPGGQSAPPAPPLATPLFLVKLGLLWNRLPLAKKPICHGLVLWSFGNTGTDQCCLSEERNLCRWWCINKIKTKNSG